MSIRIMLWGLNAALVLVAALFIAALLIVLASPWIGEPLLSTWTIAVDRATAPASLHLARTDFSQGQLLLLGADGWLVALTTANVLVAGLLAVAMLGLLRQFATEVRARAPFSDNSARRLRWIAYLLIAWPLWQATHSILSQAWLLSRASLVAPDITLLHTLAPDSASADAVRLLVDADVAAAIAGLILLVVANAFAHGITLRRDLEEIV